MARVYGATTFAGEGLRSLWAELRTLLQSAT
jgi:hypothetical protein